MFMCFHEGNLCLNYILIVLFFPSNKLRLSANMIHTISYKKYQPEHLFRSKCSHWVSHLMSCEIGAAWNKLYSHFLWTAGDLTLLNSDISLSDFALLCLIPRQKKTENSFNTWEKKEEKNHFDITAELCLSDRHLAVIVVAESNQNWSRWVQIFCITFFIK